MNDTYIYIYIYIYIYLLLLFFFALFLLASTHFRWVTKKITVKLFWHPQPALNSQQDKTGAKNIKNETKINKKKKTFTGIKKLKEILHQKNKKKK